MALVVALLSVPAFAANYILGPQPSARRCRKRLNWPSKVRPAASVARKASRAGSPASAFKRNAACAGVCVLAPDHIAISDHEPATSSSAKREV